MSYYFQYIDRKERENVNFFVSDMYDGYKYVHDVWFPSSIHIIDTFHFIRLFTDAINRIRIKVMKQYSKESDQYYILKKYYFVLEMSKKKFKKNKVFFKKFGREMNYYDLLNLVINVDERIWQLVLRVYKKYMIKFFLFLKKMNRLNFNELCLK